MTSPLAALRGESARITAIRAQVERILARQSGGRRLPPLLILGETGTGKGLLARAVHQAGPRRDRPFVDVNCAAIPETLLEAELFGYERGAFTDARQAKPGLFQAAHGGTIFLDEIGLLPVSLQGKLLGVLENRAVRRLGSTRAEPADAALIAATSVDLKRAVADRNFRVDLYHRLAVISLELPPLRARGTDIVVLGEYFLARACADYGLSQRVLTSEARELLVAYPWPGNVRQLANAMERVALLSETEAITAGMLDFLVGEVPAPNQALQADNAAETASEESLDAALRARIEAALRSHGGNIRATATALGLSRNTLRARMDKYGLRRRGSRDSGTAGAESPHAPATLVPTAPVQWERRHLAFLRARVRSSTLVEATRTREIITQKVESFGGRLEELGPTDVVAVFGIAPIDNAPSHATLAALGIQKAAAHASAGASQGFDVIVAIHCAEHLVCCPGAQIGVDGKAATWSVLETLVGRHSFGLLVISEAVVPFVTRRFALEPVRATESEAWLVLRREDTPVARNASRFVGRVSELELLRQASARAEQGRGQVVSVVGDAGVGKSRLFHEAARRLPGWLVLSSGGAPYAQNTPYFPIVEMLKALWGIPETDGAVEVQQKVVYSLRAIGGDADWLMPPLLDLLGVLPSRDAFRDLDPSKRRQRTHDAVKQVLLAASLAPPLCLIVEDLHWVDSETQAILDLLAESIAGSRVLLLVNCRPEYRHGWGSRSAYSQMRLGPLLGDGVEELLMALLGADPSLGPLKQSLIARTEGNPFFLEECVRTLAETGVIAGESAAYRLGNVAGNWMLPMTVHAVIASRVGRLSREEKLLLQSASVIGKDVREAVLRSIAEVTGARFEAMLASLRHAEFIQETRTHPDPEYAFTHPLTHEVVYESLPGEQRRDLHAAIVDAIERQPDRLAEQVDRIAHHALCGEVWPKALAYLRQAGVRAATRSAYREAVSCFEQALIAVTHLPDSRETRAQAIDVQLELQGPLGALGEKQKSWDYMCRAKDLAVALEDQTRLGRVLAVECINARAALEFDRALEAGEQALTIATELRALHLEAIARYGLGVTSYDLGDFVRARDLLCWVVDALDPRIASGTDGRARQDLAGQKEGDTGKTRCPTMREVEAPIPHTGAVWKTLKGLGMIGLGLGPTMILVRPRAWLTLTLGYLGRFVEGISVGEEAIRIAEAGGHEWDCLLATNALGSLYIIKGDLARAIPQLERSLTLSRSWSLVGWSIAGSLGLAYAQSERYDEAFRILDEALDGSKKAGDDMRTCRFRQIGEIYLLAGQIVDAGDHARRALDLARDGRQRGFEALALRLLAEIALHRDRFQPAEAEEYSRQALALASQLGMRPLIAQCHLDLGTLYRRMGWQHAEKHLTTATAMLREMEMTYWLEKSRYICKETRT